MQKDYSLNALIDFLERASKQGWMKTNTANALRASSKAVFDILDEEQKKDLSAIDVDTIVDRFINLKGKDFQSDSLKTYRSRTKKAVTEFVAWTDDPEHWKPISQRKQRFTPITQNKSDAYGQASVTEDYTEDNSNNRPGTKDISISYDLPIRDNFVARIILPRDLTKPEAKRIQTYLSGILAGLSEQYADDQGD